MMTLKETADYWHNMWIEKAKQAKILKRQHDALEDLAEEAIEAYCDTEYNEEHGDELRERLSKIREGK